MKQLRIILVAYYWSHDVVEIILTNGGDRIQRGNGTFSKINDLPLATFAK